MIYLILLRSSIATLVAWAGGALGYVLGKGVRRHLVFLVNVSLGALLAVTVLDILPDSKALLSIPIFVVGVVSGIALFWLIGKYVYPICPACALPSDNPIDGQVFLRTAVLLMITLGLHSFMDGAAVVVGDKLSHGVNIAVFLAVSLHKLPEGLALMLLLVGAGLPRRKALLYTVAIESATELGAVVALIVVDRLSNISLGIVFANIGGGFLYLVVNAFLGQFTDSSLHEKQDNRVASYATGGIGFLAAAAVMLFADSVSR